LRDEFQVPVTLENDADAAALAESHWGVGQGSTRFLYVTVSTGIGGGLVLDGRLYRGVDGSHPEIGHHVVDPSGPRCSCGARGCWEALASGPALVKWARENAGAEDRLPDDLSAEDLCRRAERGDPLALRALEREGYYLGLGLANLMSILCPDKIALGGGLIQSAPLFLPRARQVIRENCALVPSEKMAVEIASRVVDVALIGAARVWQCTFGKGERN
jgi:glucokinase